MYFIKIDFQLILSLLLLKMNHIKPSLLAKNRKATLIVRLQCIRNTFAIRLSFYSFTPSTAFRAIARQGGTQRKSLIQLNEDY